MSKGGGAGKVYFVLYLAVVLELLIIIVERDEAEQSLLQKQKETMKIVESILSQLQSGAGTEGINTRPQDEITLPPSGVNIKEALGVELKSNRKYIVEVGVTDISSDLKRKEGESEKDYVVRLKKLVELGNVEEIEYQVFFSSSQDAVSVPTFPSDGELMKQGIDFKKFQPGQTIASPDGMNSWQLQAVRKLKLDKDATFNSLNLSHVTMDNIVPVYPKSAMFTTGNLIIPQGLVDDSLFFYSNDETSKKAGQGAGDLKKRSFVVNFQPPASSGWYKLRFASKTNRILGVRADASPANLDEDATVNIGTVQLTVRDLQKVRKELTAKLDKYNLPTYESLAMNKDIDKFDEALRRSVDVAAREQDAAELVSKIRLYGYIVKLLAPGMSTNFDQNRGSIEFNIRVIQPKPKIAKPTVDIVDAMACFDKVPHVFEIFISPYQGNSNVSGVVLDKNGSQVARVNAQPTNETASASTGEGGGRVYRGTVDKALEPGKYTVQITHNIGGSESASDRAELDIFETGLTKESQDYIKNMISYAEYGNRITFNAIPNSGGKIKSNQFRIYLRTDANSQQPAVEGLAVSQEQALFLPSNANKVEARISWVQPYTGQEIDLLPATTVDIKQGKPKINIADKIDQVSQSGNRVRVTVRNLKVKKPNDGQNETSLADVSFSADKPQVESRLQGIVDIASEPVIERDDESYSVTFDLQVALPRGTDMISGIVNVPVKAVATNKANGKRSVVEDKMVKVNIKYEQEAGGRRPSGGGGNRPSGGGGRRGR